MLSPAGLSRMRLSAPISRLAPVLYLSAAMLVAVNPVRVLTSPTKISLWRTANLALGSLHRSIKLMSMKMMRKTRRKLLKQRQLLMVERGAAKKNVLRPCRARTETSDTELILFRVEEEYGDFWFRSTSKHCIPLIFLYRGRDDSVVMGRYWGDKGLYI